MRNSPVGSEVLNHVLVVNLMSRLDPMPSKLDLSQVKFEHSVFYRWEGSCRCFVMVTCSALPLARGGWRDWLMQVTDVYMGG